MPSVSTKHWFLLQYKPNSHRLALRNLHRQGFETFFADARCHSAVFDKVCSADNRPLFPGYMFVSFELDTAPWRKINSTVGVTRLVSFNGWPKALPTDLIAGLMARCDIQGKVLPADQFAPGDEVQVISGPFADYIATIEKIDADNRIWLLMEFMGQKTQMAVRPGQMQLTK